MQVLYGEAVAIHTAERGRAPPRAIWGVRIDSTAEGAHCPSWGLGMPC